MAASAPELNLAAALGGSACVNGQFAVPSGGQLKPPPLGLIISWAGRFLLVLGTETTTSGIARAAGVGRSFLYRHRDLLAKIHALEAARPPPAHRLAR
jgi:hypothetical protein